jgi:hypothetical protein
MRVALLGWWKDFAEEINWSLHAMSLFPFHFFRLWKDQ